MFEPQAATAVVCPNTDALTESFTLAAVDRERQQDVPWHTTDERVSRIDEDHSLDDDWTRSVE